MATAAQPPAWPAPDDDMGHRVVTASGALSGSQASVQPLAALGVFSLTSVRPGPCRLRIWMPVGWPMIRQSAGTAVGPADPRGHIGRMPIKVVLGAAEHRPRIEPWPNGGLRP